MVYPPPVHSNKPCEDVHSTRKVGYHTCIEQGSLIPNKSYHPSQIGNITPHTTTTSKSSFASSPLSIQLNQASEKVPVACDHSLSLLSDNSGHLEKLSENQKSGFPFSRKARSTNIDSTSIPTSYLASTASKHGAQKVSGAFEASSSNLSQKSKSGNQKVPKSTLPYRTSTDSNHHHTHVNASEYLYLASIDALDKVSLNLSSNMKCRPGRLSNPGKIDFHLSPTLHGHQPKFQHSTAQSTLRWSNGQTGLVDSVKGNTSGRDGSKLDIITKKSLSQISGMKGMDPMVGDRHQDTISPSPLSSINECKGCVDSGKALKQGIDHNFDGIGSKNTSGGTSRKVKVKGEPTVKPHQPTSSHSSPLQL